MKEERKERKIQKRKKKISRFPKKPEVLVREHALEKRRVSKLLIHSETGIQCHIRTRRKLGK